MTTYLGIDPGKRGAIAVLGELLATHPMPLLGPVSKASTVINWDEFADAFVYPCMSWDERPFYVVEDQIAMPGISNSAISKIFLNLGIIEGMLRLAGMPFQKVKPQTWQKVMYVNEPPRDDKKVTSAIVAQRLFPGFDFRRTDKCKKVDDGMTDAALLAEYGRRKNL